MAQLDIPNRLDPRHLIGDGLCPGGFLFYFILFILIIINTGLRYSEMHPL